MNKKNVDLGIKPSKIREIFEYGKKRKKEIGEDNVFDFSIGNPSVPTPKEVNDTLIELIKNSESTYLHGYTSANGDNEVRNSIASYLNKTYNANLKGDYIFLTCGAAAGLAITFNALLNEGDEVIAFAPHFPDYRTFVGHAKGKLITCPCDKKCKPDLAALERLINSNTKIVLYNSPNNPTGVFYEEELIVKMCEIVAKKQKEFNHPIYIVSDEPYRELLFEDYKYPFLTNYYNNAIVTYSFSKSLSIPGERIGYIAVNPKCEDADTVYYAVKGAAWALGYISAPSLFQFLIPHILGKTSDLSKYKENRDLLYKILTDIGYEVVYPDGAFYMFVKALEDDAEHFVEVAKEYELLLVPSNSFDITGYVRVAYCVKKKTIENSQEAFKKLYQRYKGGN